MSLDADDEILQDFLIEAGEILEQLSEQLVDLEQRPEDSDLLNAIFRGFHTVKGGAGFLQLNALVDCCHYAENIFDRLRNGQSNVTPDMMDVFLQVLDTVNAMFNMVREGQIPTPASPDLMAKLEHYANDTGEEMAEPADESSSEEVPVSPEPVEVSAPEPPPETISDVTSPVSDGSGDSSEDNAAAGESTSSDEITDEEFEQLLDALEDPTQSSESSTAAPEQKSEPDSENGKALSESPTAKSTTPESNTSSGADLFDEISESATQSSSDQASSDEITEDEFEALLEKLHDKKDKSPAAPKENISAEPASDAASNANEITDSEFEQLLDQLHGNGAVKPVVQEEKAPAAAQAEPVSPAAPPKQNESKVEPKPKVEVAASQKSEKIVAAPKAAKPTPDSTPQPAAVKKAPSPAASSVADSNKVKPTDIAAAEATVRVDTKRLDDIMNMVGELVLVRNRLVRLGLKSSDESMAKAVANLDVVTGDLQASVMKTRMQPIKKVFGRFPRVVRDLARTLKKEVNLELKGEETDLDKNLVEALADPLVHLVRNAVDHGIEMPDVREANGKPRTGKVILSAEQEGDHILLSIRDDGHGMKADSLRRKAVEKGLYDQDSADRLTASECFNLIFAPGFSTKSEISDISGRGVGMDVVKTKISQLNGTINIESEEGVGSLFMIKVPLTLAIMPTLMVMLGKQAFALPLVNVNEIFHLDLSKTNRVDGKEVAVIREKALPLFHLKRWLVKDCYDTSVAEQSHVVVVSVGTQKVGFVVDQLIGQEEVVIKPLGKMLQGTPGMAGATITGDGRIALILDVPSMLNRYA